MYQQWLTGWEDGIYDIGPCFLLLSLIGCMVFLLSGLESITKKQDGKQDG